MTAPVLSVPLLLLLAAAAAGPAPDDAPCEVRREVSAELPAEGLGGALISAGAGALEVTGTTTMAVQVRGVICASDSGLADDARLVVERRREAAWIETDLPETRGWGHHYVRMDLVVALPAALSADIRDGSGGMLVRDIAAVRIDDSSGEVEVRSVPGEVEIDDSSGEIRIRDVGTLTVRDGSGEIEVTGVDGDVRVLEDGSGAIEIRDVSGNVRIDDDGSGSIRVERVTGDLTVVDDGSGSIDYRDVQGRVSLPERR